MATPRVMILRAPGTNCDLETEFAFQQAGAVTDRIHVNRLIENPRVADPFQVLCLPGGFSYGDDIGAGRILAGQLRHHLADMLSSFRERKRLILGICNGFQVLIQTGMLVDQNFASDAQVTLAGNERGKFEDRWVALKVQPSPCVVLAGIERLYLPVAHAEGRFVTRDARVLDRLTARQQLALCYTTRDPSANGQVPYPANPNGSYADVAGICDATGRVFGLMPHPERFIDRTQHPRWTRETLPPVGDGLRIFQNAVAFFA